MLLIDRKISWQQALKEVAFDDTPIGSIGLFEIKGTVKFKLIAIGLTDVVSTSASISAGVSEATTALIPLTSASNITQDSIWINSVPVKNLTLYDDAQWRIGVNTNIILNVTGDSVDSGKILFILEYQCLDDNAKVIVS